MGTQVLLTLWVRGWQISRVAVEPSFHGNIRVPPPFFVVEFPQLGLFPRRLSTDWMAHPSGVPRCRHTGQVCRAPFPTESISELSSLTNKLMSIHFRYEFPFIGPLASNILDDE
jgi:hypothetical protein